MARTCHGHKITDGCKVAKPEKDLGNVELLRVLQEMFDENATITARSAVKRHKEFNNASDITRNPRRRTLFEEWQGKQERARQENPSVAKQSREDISRLLATQEMSIDELKAQRLALIDSHVQMLKVVAAMGGMRKMREFYETYRTLRNQLVKAGLFPVENVTHSDSKNKAK
jgi:hypothetical protein